MPVDLQRLEEIFAEALTKHDPSAREAYVAQSCGDDGELRARVEAMLAAHEAAGSFLRLPGANGETPPFVKLSEQPGTVIGRFKLLEQIGEGGFGVVFMAEQEEPVRRLVALKIIKLGMDTRQVVARFEAERQALAMMDHPHVAKVLDGGATETGRPYFVMELVKGIPITEYCDKHNLSIAQRLELFGQVCQAVQHAHQKGLIHRDIKPTNVLVSTQDDRPMAKVIDFGVAKAMQTRLTEKTLFTEFHQLVGTPAYMSPEQAAGDLDIDTRSDVYSLGVLLYEILVGTPPFDPQLLRSKAFAEMQRVICEVEPPTPSNRLSGMKDTLPSIAAHRAIEPRKLAALLRGELDWIIMKALEKDRKRRYPTANALAADVQRFLADEPVEACPPSASYRFKKFARKNWKQLATMAAFAGLLIAGTTISVWQAYRATTALEETRKANERTEKALAESEEERRLAEAVSNYLTNVFRSPDPQRDGLEVKVVDLLKQAEEELDADFSGSPRIKGKLLTTLGTTYLSLGLPERAVPVFEKARTEMQRSLGADDIDTILCENDLALAYRISGQLEESLELSEDSYRRAKNHLGADHPETIRCLSNLADAYRDAGLFEKAIPPSEEVLKVRRDKLGPKHDETLLSMSNLAQTYHAAGRQPEALALLEETLKLRRANFEPSHPATIMCMNNLSVAYRAAGRFDQAVSLSEDAYEIAQEKLGPDHINTIMCMGNLAAVYAEAERFDDALPLLKKTFEIRKLKLGPGHPSTLMSMNNLAMTYKHAGQLDEAIPLLEETLRLKRENIGLEHPNTIISLSNLALAYADEKRFDEAIPMFQETLELMRKHFGVDHPETLLTMNNLADIYRETDQLPEAEELAEETLRLLRAKLGDDHPATLRSMGNLAGVYLAQRRPADAEKLFQELLAIEKKRIGGENLEYAVILERIGTVLLEEQQPANAEAYLREAFVIREKNQPEDWTTFQIKSLLGESLLGQEKYPETEPLLLAGYEGLQAHPAANPAVAQRKLREAAGRLAKLYDAWSKPDEAKKWQEIVEGLKSESANPAP